MVRSGGEPARSVKAALGIQWATGFPLQGMAAVAAALATLEAAEATAAAATTTATTMVVAALAGAAEVSASWTHAAGGTWWPIGCCHECQGRLCTCTAWTTYPLAEICLPWGDALAASIHSMTLARSVLKLLVLLQLMSQGWQKGLQLSCLPASLPCSQGWCACWTHPKRQILPLCIAHCLRELTWLLPPQAATLAAVATTMTSAVTTANPLTLAL